jgi:predicted GIY-YIG superfamily endonuclease
MIYVYELRNKNNDVEYIGETKRPKERLWDHRSKNGKFAGRYDLTMNILFEFDNRKDAWYKQVELQKEYGFETDLDKKIRGAIAGGIVARDSGQLQRDGHKYKKDNIPWNKINK